MSSERSHSLGLHTLIPYPKQRSSYAVDHHRQRDDIAASRNWKHLFPSRRRASSASALSVVVRNHSSGLARVVLPRVQGHPSVNRESGIAELSQLFVVSCQAVIARTTNLALVAKQLDCR